MENDTQETTTLGGGCFWCAEAIFSQLRGVKDVVSGYSGGNVENPTYEQVCSGATGHADCPGRGSPVHQLVGAGKTNPVS